MAYVDGWRGRIGLISPAPGSSTEKEFNKHLPEGVAVLTTRIPLEGGITVEMLSNLGPYIDAAATMLVGADVDLLVFACTAGSLVKGPGYDKEIIKRLQDKTGLPVTTTSTGVLDSLTALKAKRVAIATPYPQAVNQAEVDFLKGAGFEVTAIKGLEAQKTTHVPQVPPGQMYRLSREVFTEDADVMFISCTGLHVLGIIEKLEGDLGRPVITSNQVTLWSALRKLNIKEKIDGLGQLFDL